MNEHADERAATKPPSSLWRFMLYLLLAVECGYLIAEVAFNAALLNVASGALGGPGDVEILERAGRLLSGFGLGLLIYGAIVASKRHINAVQALALILIFPPAMAGMYQLQEYLVDEAIVETASDEQRFAAQYLTHLGPALRDGMVRIEDIPLTPDTMGRPESKAFLTLATPLLLHNRPLVDALVTSTPDIIKYSVYLRAMEELDVTYERYQEAEKGLHSAWYRYQQGVTSTQHQANKTATNFQTQARFRQMNALFAKFHRSYEDNPRRLGMPPPGLSARDFVFHPATLKMLDIEPEFHHLFTPATVSIGTTGYFGRRTIQVDGTKAYTAAIEARARKRFQTSFERHMTTEGLISTGQAYALSPIPFGLGKEQFFRNEWVQAAAHEQARLPEGTDLIILPGWSKDEVFNKVLLPISWSKADQFIGALPTDVAAAGRGNDTSLTADTAIRVAYVPAIALAISLLFSFLTVGKITGRLWMIVGGKAAKPGPLYQAVRWIIPILTLGIILAAPNWMRTNSLAQSGVISAAATEDVPAPLVAALQWTLQMEPLLYPAGNAVLGTLQHGQKWNLDIAHYATYHNPESSASASNTTASIDDVLLQLPLPVRQLQSILDQLGHSPGGVDGVIGRQTIEALKRFQQSNGLQVSGEQDEETIRELRKRL